MVGLRSLKLACGGTAAAAEARLMVNEKIKALHELQILAFSGALGGAPASMAAATLKLARRKVRANRRRLQGRRA